MRVLPVLDLLRGQVVHAVRGERQSYRPIRSTLCSTAFPADIASALVEHFRFREAYVADLDAIAHREAIQWNALRAVHDAGLRIWLDAGWHAPDDIQHARDELLDYGLADTTWVIGLESWHSSATFLDIVRHIPAEQLVFSLDLRSGNPLTCSNDWPEQPIDIASAVVDGGVRQLLVLDLAQVGSAAGPTTLGLCQTIKERWPHVHVLMGGGIRGVHDCRRAAASGCDMVLMATALHTGQIAPEDLAEFQSYL